MYKYKLIISICNSDYCEVYNMGDDFDSLQKCLDSVYSYTENICSNYNLNFDIFKFNTTINQMKGEYPDICLSYIVLKLK